ncbi:MAG: lytic transglycosylase domain-containing protein [Acidimicrobiia bacterium]|nr:lytic transglycosylase domain-containing protein [Acidimicrobiia bacterium]
MPPTRARARRRPSGQRLAALVTVAALAGSGCSSLLDSVPDTAGPTTTTSLPIDRGPAPTPGRGGPTTSATLPGATPSTTAVAPTTTAATDGPAGGTPGVPASASGAPGDAFGRADAVAVRHGVGVAQDGAPLLAATPELLAAQLALAEGALHDPASPLDRLDLMAHLQQLVYRRVALRPALEGAFFAALAPAWHDVARRHLVARRLFVSPTVNSVDDLPAWTIVAPAPAEQLFAAYGEAEAAYGVPWQVLAAMNLVESAMGRIQGPSSEGALGPMQFDGATWAAYGGGGDVGNPRDAVLGAANFLAANGYAVDPASALFRLRGDWQYAAGVHAYADLLRVDPAQYGAIWRWQVYYANNVGDVWLPVGYSAPTRIPTHDYLATHPASNP